MRSRLTRLTNLPFSRRTDLFLSPIVRLIAWRTCVLSPNQILIVDPIRLESIFWFAGLLTIYQDRRQRSMQVCMSLQTSFQFHKEAR
jgi:hypothetical protein